VQLKEEPLQHSRFKLKGCSCEGRIRLYNLSWTSSPPIELVPTRFYDNNL